MSNFLSPSQAREHYDLRLESTDRPTEIEQALASAGIAAIEMPLSAGDFAHLSQGFAVCLEECPELLQATAHTLDARYGGDAGYVRKEKKVNPRTGIQIGDPKHYFHFNEQARGQWHDQFAKGPQVLRDFLADGYEIHDGLITLARRNIAQLEETHPNISSLYFPKNDGTQPESYSFLRLLRYDGYKPHDQLGEVAKPHYDIGGVTIQAYADASGFWAAHDGIDGQRRYYDTNEHEAYMFLGKGHEKVYGDADRLRPLWHGVDRVVPAGVTWVPERTAVILFVDAPEVDYHVRQNETTPYIKMGELALA